MLSTNNHHYQQAYGHIPSPNSYDHQHHHLAAQHLGISPFDLFVQPSPYGPSPFQQGRHVLPSGSAEPQPIGLPHSSGPIAKRREMIQKRSARSGTSSGPVRRRISRACDQCNHLRTKCDGRQSCAHCLEFGLTCEYMRERKKRGKASRKDTVPNKLEEATEKDEDQAEDAASPSHANPGEPKKQDSPNLLTKQKNATATSGPSASSSSTRGESMQPTYSGTTQGMSVVDSFHEGKPLDLSPAMSAPQLQIQTSVANSLVSEPRSIDSFYQHASQPDSLAIMQSDMRQSLSPQGLEYCESPYSISTSQGIATQATSQSFSMPQEAIALDFATQSSTVGPPEWMLSPPTAAIYFGGQQHDALRFPVLQPLVPYLSNIVSLSLAYDLLEHFFQSTINANLENVSPHAMGQVFRKHSFLRSNNPRVCSPGLLASILWIGCLTSESPLLVSSPTTRGQLADKLLSLTIGFLKPLEQKIETGLMHMTGTLDDAATYMNLAIMTASSEYKAASLRWWNAAWSLARGLQLDSEDAMTPPAESDDMMGMDMGAHQLGSFQNQMQEQTEERRRMWWLLHAVDNQLATSHNRSMALLETDCPGFMQPFDDRMPPFNDDVLYANAPDTPFSNFSF